MPYYEELFSKVRINKKGAIILGNSVVCDGFESDLHAAVFTHIHKDHISKDFETCMHRYDVYTSKTTEKLLEAITEDIYRGRTQFHSIDYNSPCMIKCGDKGDLLTLIESKHMLGASQVFLKTWDKFKILYSGDISPNDKPPQCDILVLDSTHGTPIYDKNIESDSLNRRLLDFVNNAIDNGKPVCVHAHRGKLQYIMHLLTLDDNIPVSVPFIAKATDARLAGVYTNSGMKIRKIHVSDTYEGNEIRYGEYPYVEFKTGFEKSLKEEHGEVQTLCVAGRPGKYVMNNTEQECWIASDAHAEFSAILEYVKKANPRIVITDNIRSKHGVDLAEHIEQRLDIRAKALPE